MGTRVSRTDIDRSRPLSRVVVPVLTFVVMSMMAPDRASAQDPSMAQGDHAAGGADAQSPSSGSVLSSFMEPFEYDPQGRKDPFQMPTTEKPLPPGAFHGPVLPLQKFRLEELALTGIIWDVSRPRAMITDPTGRVHVVGPYAKLGSQNGYIAVIREGEMVVIETYEEEGKLLSAPRIVKLSGGAKAGTTTAAGR